MKRVLGIVRASTERQETESQKLELCQYLNGYGYSDDEIEIIEVAGASARKKNKKYLEMLETVKATILVNKSIKAVGLWNLDRLGRVDDSLIEMKNWFINNRIQLYCKSPSLVLLNEDGTVNGGAEIAYGVFASLVKQQTEDIFNKFQRGKARNSKDGKFNGGASVKFGYKLDSNNYVVPDHDKGENDMSPVEFVLLVYNMYSSGKYSIEKLRKELNDRGYKHNGKNIKGQFLIAMLKDTAYIGYTDSDSKHTHRKYIPIIDEDLWKKVESVRNGNVIRTTSKESKYSHFAVKLLKCRCCGANYIASGRVYLCYKQKMKHRFESEEQCTESTGIAVDVLDELLWRIASMNHIDYLERLSSEAILEHQERLNVIAMKSNEANNRLASLEAKKQRIKKLYLDGDLTDKEYDLEKVKLESNKEQFKSEIALLESEANRLNDLINKATNPDYIEGIERLADIAYDVMTTENYKMQSEIVHQHIRECYLDKVNIEGDNRILIEIIDILDRHWKFVYSPSAKRAKNNYLWSFDANGEIVADAISDEERQQYIEDLKRAGLI